MYARQVEAEEKRKTCIFSNWTKGVLAMGGATCIGGMVTLFTYHLGWNKITHTRLKPSYNLNNDTELEHYHMFVPLLSSWKIHNIYPKKFERDVSQEWDAVAAHILFPLPTQWYTRGSFLQSILHRHAYLSTTTRRTELQRGDCQRSVLP